MKKFGKYFIRALAFLSASAVLFIAAGCGWIYYVSEWRGSEMDDIVYTVALD